MASWGREVPVFFLLWVACSVRDPAPAEREVAPASPAVVQLRTRDRVRLAADVWAASGPERPGIVLLHMTPLGPWDRTDWPRGFVARLHGHDWSVIAIDRRGAGDSGGVPEEAFTGETGRYDVEAAVRHLQTLGVGEVAIIGASNGTTSMIDYAAWAGGEGLPIPVAHGYLSGGPYTEAQTAMADVPVVPSLFAYPETEAAWSEAQRVLDPGGWQFHEFPGSDHGTNLFGAHPELADRIDGWLADVFGG